MRHNVRRFSGGSVCVAILLLVHCGSVQAHEGPPFPLLMDVPIELYSVSVWTDPDIGEALFYVVLESDYAGALDRELDVFVWVVPVSGRLSPVTYPADPQRLRNRLQFEARPYFDQADTWTVGFQIESDVFSHQMTATVQSTPDGFGVWDLVIYSFPFLMLAILWTIAIVRRGKRR